MGRGYGQINAAPGVMNGMPGKRVSRLGILETLESAEGEESRFSFHYLYSYRDTDSKNIVLE